MSKAIAELSKADTVVGKKKIDRYITYQVGGRYAMAQIIGGLPMNLGLAVLDATGVTRTGKTVYYITEKRSKK